MQTLYAVEAWVLAILGWAWLTLRALMPGQRPLVEEWAHYGNLLICTLTLLLCALVKDRVEVMKGHLGFMLISWTFVAYACFDSITFMGGADSRFVVEPLNSSVCCPNADVALMNRAFYFGGASYAVPVSAVTLAFQTMHVFIASAGAMVEQGTTAWPGNGWGYGVAALISTVYVLRYSPGALDPPCPRGEFTFLFASGLHYGLVFTIFMGGMHLMILLDVAPLPASLLLLARLAGAAFVGLFCAAVFFASDGRGMMTIQLWMVLLKAGLSPIWGVVEMWWLNAPPAPAPKRPRTLRWVMPMETPCLPTPLVMSCPPRARVNQEKKRL